LAIERYFIEQGDMADTTDLADVVLSGAVQNEVLVRDGSSQWVNQLLDTASMEDAAVTLAKIANAAANDKLLGSGDSGSGSPYVEITLGSGLTMTGTTLSATGGGGAVDAVTEDINQSSHGFSVGDLLDHNGTIFILADSDDEATSDVQGVVSVNTDSNNFEITYSGKITLSGLTGGLQYYLSGTAGAATSTEPTEGNIVAPVYYAISTTVAIVNVQRPIQVTDSNAPSITYTKTTSDQLITGTTLTNVTNLVFPVVSGRYYRFSFSYRASPARALDGIKISITTPTFTAYNALVTSWFDASVQDPSIRRGAFEASGDTYATPAEADKFGNDGVSILLTAEGVIKPSADGNVQLQIAKRSDVGGDLTIGEGSNGILWDMGV